MSHFDVFRALGRSRRLDLWRYPRRALDVLLGHRATQRFAFRVRRSQPLALRRLE